MEPKPTSLAAASAEVTGEGCAEPRSSGRDAACQTDHDLFLGPAEPAPATKRKNFEEQSMTTNPEEDELRKKAKQLGWSGPAGMPLSVPGILEEAGLVMGTSETDEENRQRDSTAILSEIVTNLPTLRNPKDPDTAEAVASSRDKAIVMAAARSVVCVSSVPLDGKVTDQCSGIVVGWNEATMVARVLTCFRLIGGVDGLIDPKPKLHVHLPNKAVSEGQLLFYSEHYDIALVEIRADAPLEIPSFGSSPNYGQEVFVLTRDSESYLMARHGTISWLDNSDVWGRDHRMFLRGELTMNSDGGAVIDHDGNVVGMAFDEFNDSSDGTGILAVSTILGCIEMWMKFSRIARPIHGLRLRTIEMLNVAEKERIYYDYKINSGYIVNEVETDSTAEKLGIRSGDVIVSFDKFGIHSLPRLEDLLLSLGWEFLHSRSDSSTVDLKFEVYDLVGRCTRSITLPVELCDASLRVRTR
ncbi:hypothetical protein EJB05_40009, partial [Eragrostis curvula]